MMEMIPLFPFQLKYLFCELCCPPPPSQSSELLQALKVSCFTLQLYYRDLTGTNISF